MIRRHLRLLTRLIADLYPEMHPGNSASLLLTGAGLLVAIVFIAGFHAGFNAANAKTASRSLEAARSIEGNTEAV